MNDLQIKDLRTFLNCMLVLRFGFSPKESGSYIGNSKEVNEKHYTFADQTILKEKMNRFSFDEVIGRKK